MISVAPATISGMEIARPKPISQGWPLAAAAMASTLSRLMTMSAIATVFTAPHRLSELAMLSSLASSCTSSLMAIQSSRRPPTSFSHGKLEHVLQDDGEDDAQQHRGAGAEDDAPHALRGGSAAAGQRDDDGVVAGQKDVDPDDLEDLDADRTVIAERQAELCDKLVDQVPAPPVASLAQSFRTSHLFIVVPSVPCIGGRLPLPRRASVVRCRLTRRPHPRSLSGPHP